MRIDLTKLIGADGASFPFEGQVDLTGEELYGAYPFQSPVTYSGTIVNHHDVLRLTGTIKTILNTCCSRCLKPLDILLTAEADVILSRDEAAEEEDDVFPLAENAVEVEDILVPSLLLQVDMTYLCKEDCAGLCPVCGCDRNETACTCQTRQIDPRWAKLAALLDKQNDADDSNGQA